MKLAYKFEARFLVLDIRFQKLPPIPRNFSEDGMGTAGFCCLFLLCNHASNAPAIKTTAKTAPNAAVAAWYDVIPLESGAPVDDGEANEADEGLGDDVMVAVMVGSVVAELVSELVLVGKRVGNVGRVSVGLVWCGTC